MKNLQVLRNEIKIDLHNDFLKEIYVDESLLPYQKTRYINLLDRFQDSFGAQDVEIYSVPGRIEIIGNHTDHQRGNVMTAAINLDIIAVCAKNDQDTIEIMQEDYAPISIRLDELEKRPEEKGTTEALIRGVTSKLISNGYIVKGFKTYIAGDVSVGSGLSSSAMFEVLIGTILSGLYNDSKISMLEIAKIAQYAENVYFEKPCGLMDQTACALGGTVHIDFINARHPLVHIDYKNEANPQINRIDFDLSAYGHSLCIVDTNSSHADLTDEYVSVPVEMKSVAQYFEKKVLADVDENMFLDNIANIRSQTGDRAVLRAMHFFKDNKRVREQMAVLQEGNFEKFLELVQQSGNSSFKYLQNVYSTNDIQNQGLSIGLALSENVLGGRGASRVHGGGFAGTILAFVPDEIVTEYKTALDKVFGKDACKVLQIRKYGGIKVF